MKTLLLVVTLLFTSLSQADALHLTIGFKLHSDNNLVTNNHYPVDTVEVLANDTIWYNPIPATFQQSFVDTVGSVIPSNRFETAEVFYWNYNDNIQLVVPKDPSTFGTGYHVLYYIRTSPTVQDCSLQTIAERHITFRELTRHEFRTLNFLVPNAGAAVGIALHTYDIETLVGILIRVAHSPRVHRLSDRSESAMFRFYQYIFPSDCIMQLFEEQQQQSA